MRLEQTAKAKGKRQVNTPALSLDKNPVLLLAPRALLDVRVEVIKPPLATLLSDPALDTLGNFAPLRDAGVDASDDRFVLFRRPWSLDEPRLRWSELQSCSREIHRRGI